MTKPNNEQEFEKELKQVAEIIKDWIIQIKDNKEQYFDIPHKKFQELFRSLLSSERQRLREEIEKTSEERFICSYCGTNYISETPCGDYRCRKLDNVPVAIKWIPFSDILKLLEE